MFLPKDGAERAKICALTEKVIAEEGQVFLGWRDVPVDNSDLGYSVKPTEPFHRHVFVGRGPACADQDAFERKLFVIRKRIFNTLFHETGSIPKGLYIASLSSRTIVYKGMLLAAQVGKYYKDLADPTHGDGAGAGASTLLHQHLSRHGRLAHPFRMICHNGEINTKRGNVNWIQARYSSMQSDLLGDDLKKLWPIAVEGQSDTACFDNALELLVMGGYSLAHAMMMLIPEAWAGNPLMDAERRAFYEYHAALMEPWDGPAAVAFTDGRQIGATLDRNGLRPARYYVTDDGFVMMASEMGVLPAPEEKIVEKWRLQPGRMLLIDLEQGRIIADDEIKAELAKLHPYQQWTERDASSCDVDMPVRVGAASAHKPADRDSLAAR